MKRLVGVLLAAAWLVAASPGWAYDGLVRKQAFTMPAYTTVGGQTIKNVRVGYETYGSLSAARDNVILVTHFFSGTSHAAGKYKADDPAPGYWDAIIGAGKPIDTDRFFVISSDTLTNLNTKDPNVVTTGPASINPDTGRPYGMTFPIVTFRDFVNVQKALLDSLGIKKLHAVVGASMGAAQAFEWAMAYPEMVERIIPVIGYAELDAFTIGWMNIWSAPILLDPRWKQGDYYGKEEPTEGLALALKIVTLHARHPDWATKAYGRKWAAPDKDPGKSWTHRYAIEQFLDQVAAARAKVADANSFLYLARAHQLFGEGGTLEARLARIKARALIIPSRTDLLVAADMSRQARDILLKQGVPVEYFELVGDTGHLEGLVGITKAGEQIRRFLAQ